MNIDLEAILSYIKGCKINGLNDAETLNSLKNDIGMLLDGNCGAMSDIGFLLYEGVAKNT